MDVWATAKINLFLTVLDRRPDGYHNIETVYQSVGLADRLTVEAASDGIVLECESREIGPEKDNLVVRAAELLRRTFAGQVSGLRIRLDKRIPVGSGLGGGSADAAATLRACNRLFHLGLSPEEMRRVGSQLGMDVPFLIEGGRAVGRERGDQLEALAVRETVWVVIAVPPVTISTRWAYERLDQRPSPQPPSVERFVASLQSEPPAVWSEMCYNEFERIVFPSFPEVKALRDRLLDAGCVGAFLSGSGAAVVGVTDDPERAARVADRVKRGCRLAEAVPFVAAAEPGRQAEGLFA